MAHHLHYLYAAVTDEPDREINGLVTSLQRDGWAVEPLDRSSSAEWDVDLDINWVSVDLALEGQDAGIEVQVNIRDASAAEAWSEVPEGHPALPEGDFSAVCFVTLSGKTDMELFDAIRGYWKVQRGAAEYDEVSGFIP